MQAYVDADWTGCPDTRRSTTSWYIFLGDSIVSWKCKKQEQVSNSSMEAEYRAMSSVWSEIIYLTRLLNEIGVRVPTPIHLYADNTSAIWISINPIYHERTKHIEVECHFIREHLEDKLLFLHHVSSSLQLADIFTRSMTRDMHPFLVSKLMLSYPHQFEGVCEGT